MPKTRTPELFLSLLTKIIYYYYIEKSSLWHKPFFDRIPIHLISSSLIKYQAIGAQCTRGCVSSAGAVSVMYQSITANDAGLTGALFSWLFVTINSSCVWINFPTPPHPVTVIFFLNFNLCCSTVYLQIPSGRAHHLCGSLVGVAFSVGLGCVTPHILLICLKCRLA